MEETARGLPDVATLESVAATLERDLKHVQGVLANPSADETAKLIEKHTASKNQQVYFPIVQCFVKL